MLPPPPPPRTQTHPTTRLNAQESRQWADSAARKPDGSRRPPKKLNHPPLQLGRMTTLRLRCAIILRCIAPITAPEGGSSYSAPRTALARPPSEVSRCHPLRLARRHLGHLRSP
eukprot:5089771-Prymnesium_polylepis.1